jgi:hypothetical protein
MNTPRDPDTIVASWLDEGPTDIPDETRRSIAIAARTSPQAHSPFDRLARRIDMSRFQTLGLVAAVAIVAVVGIVALSAFGGGQPDVGRQPASSSAASPSPSPSERQPALTETFVSPWYGYSIGYPADWEAIPALAFFDPAKFQAAGGPSEWLDVIHPTTSNGLLRAASAAIPEGGTAETVSQGYWGIQSNLVGTIIGGQPARVRDEGGEFEATVVVGDRVYVFTLFSGQGGDQPGIESGRALFDALMASVTFQPADAESEAAGPDLSETFTSPWYGYTIRYPAGWEAVPAQSAFDLLAFGAAGGPSEWLDVLHPTSSNGLFRAASYEPWPPAIAGSDDLVRLYMGFQEDLETVSIGGLPARLRVGDGEVEAAVDVDGRVYFFTLFEGQGGDQPGIANGRALFDALMASVEFHPEDAAEAPAGSPSP